MYKNCLIKILLYFAVCQMWDGNMEIVGIEQKDL